MDEVKGNAQIKNCRIIAVIIAALLGFPILLWAGQFKVTSVTDGDTINVVGNGKKEIMRLVVIDAPELPKKNYLLGLPFCIKAKEYPANLVLIKVVYIKFYGKDRHGRLLGEVFVNGVNINLEMIHAGLAEVNNGKPAKNLE
jgi:endonuclease YncB( thermonuclease family)